MIAATAAVTLYAVDKPLIPMISRIKTTEIEKIKLVHEYTDAAENNVVRTRKIPLINLKEPEQVLYAIDVFLKYSMSFSNILWLCQH